MWVAFAAVMAYLEIFQAGVAMLCKALGVRKWYLALIPVYGFGYLESVAGEFKVLSVPVRKCMILLIEMIVVIVLSGVYWQWGINHLVRESYEMLGQIMALPMAICYLIIYLVVVKSSLKIYDRYQVQKKKLYTLLSLFLLPIPVLFYLIRNNEKKQLSEMFV